MGLESKPEQVKKALLEENRRALSNMGRKGAEQANLTRILREAKKATMIEDAVEQEKQYTISEDGDVLPPDTVDLPFHKD